MDTFQICLSQLCPYPKLTLLYVCVSVCVCVLKNLYDVYYLLSITNYAQLLVPTLIMKFSAQIRGLKSSAKGRGRL